MFKSLRDKLKGLLGKDKEEDKKVAKAPKEKKKPKVKEKTQEKERPAKKESKLKEKEDKRIEKEDKSELPNLKPEEKQGFLSKLIHKKPKEEAEPENEPKEEEILEEKPKEKPKKSFFSKIISGTSTLESKQIDEIFEPLELILLENNVNLNVVDKIKENLGKDLIGIEVKKADIEKTIQDSLRSSIEQVLIEPPKLLEEIKKKNKTGDIYTIVFFGINGSGKTTSIAKLAHKLKKEGIKPLLAAADTFRAASIEQLKTHANKIGIPIIAHDYGSDPAAIAYDAKEYALKHKLNCVLVDTAGRMYTKSNLMKEMEKIIRVSKPDLKIFVAESITGNDATQQASMFNEAIGIDGIILTKADVDEKGGAALSVSQVTGKPIYYLGTGQKYEDLKDFKKADIIKNLGLD